MASKCDAVMPIGCHFRDLGLVKGFLYVFLCFTYLGPVCLVYIFWCFWCTFSCLFCCCQYQCKWLRGKTHLQNDLLCIERWAGHKTPLIHSQIVKCF